jgi:hypothetical protein
MQVIQELPAQEVLAVTVVLEALAVQEAILHQVVLHFQLVLRPDLILYRKVGLLGRHQPVPVEEDQEARVQLTVL